MSNNPVLWWGSTPPFVFAFAVLCCIPQFSVSNSLRPPMRFAHRRRVITESAVSAVGFYSGGYSHATEKTDGYRPSGDSARYARRVLCLSCT